MKSNNFKQMELQAQGNVMAITKGKKGFITGMEDICKSEEIDYLGSFKGG